MGAAQRVSVPGVGEGGAWSRKGLRKVRVTDREPGQLISVCLPPAETSSEGSPFKGPEGARVGGMVRTQRLGTLGVVGAPVPQGPVIWVLPGIPLDPHAPDTVQEELCLQGKSSLAR